MSAQYHIQLLNDLHHWFPELLYHPQRFQTVQDVLGYIIQVANETTYHRNQQQYSSYRYQMGYSPAIPSESSPSIHASAPRSVNAVYSSRRTSASHSNPMGGILDLLFADHQMEEEPHIHISSVSVQPVDNLISSILGQVLHGRRDTTAMENFLNQSVVVRPTAQHIQDHTAVTVATEEQSDNCAICQDSIEEGQEMRTIRHCHHTFHTNCIDTWFETNVRCPTCRHDIRGGPPP